MDRQKQTVTDWKSGLPETPCGAGSKVENTKMVRKLIPQIVRSYGIKSVADVGCGDQNWVHKGLPDAATSGIRYVGFDIKPRFNGIQFLDVTQEVLPDEFDLVLCIYVLNHLPPARAEQALRLLKMSGSKYLLMSYSDADEYSLNSAGELIGTWLHKDTGRHAWHYGLWRMN